MKSSPPTFEIEVLVDTSLALYPLVKCGPYRRRIEAALWRYSAQSATVAGAQVRHTIDLETST